MIARRILTTTLALLVPALLNPGGSIGAQPLTVIRIAALPIDVSGEPYYAQELGFFKEAGLDAQVTVLTNGAAVTAALLGGTYDIGVSNLIAAATAREKGLSMVVVAPGGVYSTKGPTTVCAVAKDSPLAAAKDLDGKTVGLPDLFGLPRIAVSAWLEKNGGDLASLKFVEMPFSAIVPALDAGRIDAGILVNPMLQQAVDAGNVRVLANCLDALAPEFSLSEFYTTGAYFKAHPDILKTFAAVMLRTARWANAHQRESGAILERWTKAHVTPDMARAVYGERLNPAEFQPIIDASARYKIIKSSFPAADLFAPKP
jgi:NitT/TauT family transport system substrate-binding protein